MKRFDDSTASTFQAAGRYIGRGIAAVLLLVFYGCAVPRPVTIKHESTPSLSDLVLANKQQGKEPADERIAAALADLQRRKELSDQRTAALLELLKSKKMISDDEAALLSGQTTTGTAGEPGPAAALEAKISVEEIKEEIRSEVTNELLRQVWTINNAMKEKDQRLRFGGDIRLRYEADYFDQNNALLLQPAKPADLMNTQNDQTRFKYRVRFGAEAKVNEQTDAVIRVATGSTSNPVSTNTTMGDYMNKDSVLFDLAYLKWQPTKSLTLYGGRMPNPWFSSDLVWDSDLNFEGLAMKVKSPVSESWTTYLTAGAFPLQQYDFSAHSKWLLGGQTGMERTNKKGVSAKIGAAYYNYKNITGVRDDPDHAGQTDWTAPLFIQKGNTLFNIHSTVDCQVDGANCKLALASEFKELNVTGTLDIGFWDPVHVIFLGDYVKNIGFKKGDVVERVAPGTDYDPRKEIEGYQVGMSVGYPTVQESDQWKVYFYKKHLEADAVLDAFTDSDFHLGGTNAKGWILGTDIGLAKNYWLTLRWLTANEISGAPLAIDVLQVDINARF